MPIDPIIGSALIGGGFNILDNIFGWKSNKDTNKSNYQIAQMNNQFNERMLQKQMDYNTDMWNKENAYNTPEQQRKRFEAAGLNPYMMLGNIQSGQAGSVGGVNPPTAQPVTMQPFQPDFSGIGQAAQSYVANRIQEKMAIADIELKEQEADHVRIENKYTAAKAIEMINNLKQDVTSKRLKNYYQKIQNRYAADMFSSDINYKRNQVLSIEADVRAKNVDTAIKELQLHGFPQQFQLQLAAMSADILLKSAQTKMTKQQTVHEIQKMFKTFAETRGIKINNRILERSADSIVNKAHTEQWHTTPIGILSEILGTN